MTSVLSLAQDIEYPDSDGQPMADNNKQFRWIVLIKENLDLIFANNPEVFVARDLLWHPVEGHPEIRVAPDVMVAFGRSKGDRGSYKQWQEGNIPPQVVFEVLSPGNTSLEMSRKLLFYNRYGVEEYYLYDPDRENLGGFIRSDLGDLIPIDPIEGWVSARLGIRFEHSSGEGLKLYGPTGQPFFSFAELETRARNAEQRANSAEQRTIFLAERLRQACIDPDIL
jgi:Uma2 family endonuclease